MDFKKNFKDIYERELFLLLADAERTRKKEFKRFLYELIIILVFFAGLVGYIVYCFKTGDLFSEDFMNIIAWSIVAAIGCIVGTAFFGYKASENYRKSLKAVLMPKIIKQFFDMKYGMKYRIDDDKIRKSGLFSEYTHHLTDDCFQGNYNKTGFKITETKLLSINGVGKSRTMHTVFKGVMFSFKFNKEIKANTIVATNKDADIKNFPIGSCVLCLFILFQMLPIFFMMSTGIEIDLETIFWLTVVFLCLLGVIIGIIHKFVSTPKLEKIKLEDPVFSRKFKVFSEDQVEARYLVTTAFMERFLRLNTAFGTNKAKCAFFDNNILFAISTGKNLFEIGNLFKPLTNPKTLWNFFAELSSIVDMIDYFKLDEETKL